MSAAAGLGEGDGAAAAAAAELLFAISMSLGRGCVRSGALKMRLPTPNLRPSDPKGPWGGLLGGGEECIVVPGWALAVLALRARMRLM
jgi:hypothetical protein